eukprot:4942295-Pleurochrysis_carterae.AAC.1
MPTSAGNNVASVASCVAGCCTGGHVGCRKVRLLRAAHHRLAAAAALALDAARRNPLRPLPFGGARLCLRDLLNFFCAVL